MNEPSEEQRLEVWRRLVESAENVFEGGERVESERTEDITVTEVLGIGHYVLNPPEVAVVKDTMGRIWLLPETHKRPNGLVSRWDVKPGMKLQLRLKEVAHITRETEVFVTKS